MANFIVAAGILAILVLSIAKLVMMKRKGPGCAGCSQNGTCSAKNLRPKK